jgi:hypothetical protein
MLTEETSIHRITLHADGQIVVQKVTRILRDGVEILDVRTYDDGAALAPGGDIPADADPRVVALAAIAWTPEVIAAWQEKVAREKEALAKAALLITAAPIEAEPSTSA